MKSLNIRRVFFSAAMTSFLFSLISVPVSVAADAAWRSGNPPTVVSAKFDDQRRLVVEFSAPDGMAHLNARESNPRGGSVVIDNDPVNAKPAHETSYGPLMACNNKGNCKGFWSLPTYPEKSTYTFTSPPLSEKDFPAGTYYLQVNTFNEDPYASTRQEEFSKIETVVLGKVSIAPSHIVPLLLPALIPVSNGTPICIAWRNYMAIGNLAARAQNAYNAAMNARLEKMSSFPPDVEAIYQRTLKQTSAGKAALAKNGARAVSACSPAPSAVAKNGEFVPVPVPASNGTSACKKNRDHLVYLNQELLKVVNNFRTTSISQTTRTKQLYTRFNQLTADLVKTWPLVFKACAPF